MARPASGRGGPGPGRAPGWRPAPRAARPGRGGPPPGPSLCGRTRASVRAPPRPAPAAGPRSGAGSSTSWSSACTSPWIHPFRVTCGEPRCRYGHRSLRRDGAAMTNAERERVEGFGRLEDGLRQGGDWYLWGPYLRQRQWGTGREDYSADGDAWTYLPHDQARSRAYRWGEDGMAGFSDVEQRLCLGLALWNGHDPILKERMFGLTGAEANHGEDVKEYWWYLDGVPSHACE